MSMSNPRFQKDGPKRRRRTRRETSPVSRQGWITENPDRYRRAEAKRTSTQGQEA